MNLADLYIAKKLAGGGGGGTGTDNYNDLSNKPQINGTTLTGDKSAADLELQPTIDSENPISADYVDDSASTNKFVTSSDKLTWGGKQDKIDADHKLSSDLVDDTGHTNLFVTPTEKSTWSGKQNAIDSSHKLSSDLVDDTNHTNKFVTSAEKNTWNAKQNAIDSDHKLSSSLVSFSTAEAAALASGIDSDDVNQIGVNQTNILYVEKQNGAKNLLKFDTIGLGTTISDSFVTSGVRFTRNADDSITVTRESSNTNNAYCVFILNSAPVTIDSLCDNDHYLIGCPTGGGSSSFELLAGTISVRDYGSGVLLPTLSSGQSGIIPQIVVRPAFTGTVTFKPMIITKAAHDAGFTDYQPYALPNYDLTRLEAEDRAALAEEIDAGAKNKWDFANCETGNWHATASKTDTSFTITSTDTRAYFSMWQPLPAGHYVFSAKISNLSGPDYKGIAIRAGSTSGASLGSVITFSANGTISGEFTCTATTTVYFVCYASMDSFTSATTYTVSDIMVSTKAAFGVSQKFVPYKYQSPTSIALQTETFNVAAANTYYKIFEQFVGGDSVNRLYKISAAAIYAGARPAALKVTIQTNATGSTETIAREITADTDIAFLPTDYIWRSYGGTIRVYVSYKAVTNKGAAYLIIDQYKV